MGAREIILKGSMGKAIHGSIGKSRWVFFVQVAWRNSDDRQPDKTCPLGCSLFTGFVSGAPVITPAFGPCAKGEVGVS
jgi:hypothetical protein